MCLRKLQSRLSAVTHGRERWSELGLYRLVPLAALETETTNLFEWGRFLVHHVQWCSVILVVFINTGTTPYRTGTCKNFTLVVIIWYFTYWTKMWFLPLYFEIFLFRCVRKIAKSDYQLRHVCLSLRSSVRMEQLISHWTYFHENWYLIVFRKSVEKIQFELKYDKITGTLHEDLCKFTIVSR